MSARRHVLGPLQRAATRFVALCLLAGAPAARAQDPTPEPEPRSSIRGVLDRMTGTGGRGGRSTAADLEREAATLSARGDHDEAARRLERLLASSPRDAELEYKLARELRLAAVDAKERAKRETDPGRRRELLTRAHQDYQRSLEHLLAGEDFVLSEARAIERGEKPGGRATAADLLGQLVTAYDARSQAAHGDPAPYDPASARARQALGDTYARLSSARGEDGRWQEGRGAYRDLARKQLLEVKENDPNPELRRKARATLHAMAYETPQLRQADFEADVQANPDYSSEYWASRLCGPTSGTALALGEGVRSPWTLADTYRVAFGAKRGDGVRVSGSYSGGFTKEGLANVLTDYFGYPASSTAVGTSAQVKTQLDQGRAVVVGGGKDAGPFSPSFMKRADGTWAATTHSKAYESSGHYMTIVGYREPWEQSAALRSATGGTGNAYLVRDVDTGREYALTQAQLDTFAGGDGEKWLVTHDPGRAARAQAARTANGR